MNKKDIPINILEKINEIKRENHDIIELLTTEDTIIFRDIDQKSDFHFKLWDIKTESVNNLTTDKRSFSGEKAIAAHRNWCNVIRQFNEQQDPAEHPFTNDYASEFHSNVFKEEERR